MPFTGIFGTGKKEREVLVKTIRGELENARKRGDEDGLDFICEDDIYAVWNLQRVQTLSRGLGWDQPTLQERVLKDFRKILSILVSIHWDEWDTFKRIFLDHTDTIGRLDRTDEQLPFTFEILSHQFLHNLNHRRTFFSRQYIFIPVVLIEETPYQSSHPEYFKLCRMPFLRSEQIGEGSTGLVTKELVAAKHFRYERGGPNLEELWVARKRIEREDTGGRNSRSFRTEQGALRSFKQCLTNHGNIMNSLTTFTHDGNFIIISPLADLDLRKFFCGKYSDFGVRQQRFTPLELLREAACLAGALDFLHYQLRLRDKKIACAHLDFKPDNILVQWSEGPKHFPVGKWLVHDFGTARIKEPSEEANALAPGDFLAHFSLTKAQRNPGPFQAPEVQQSKDRKVGRESDMWSFGCLLVEVLSFAIGGPDQVASLANSIYQRDPDQPNQTLTDYFYTFAANGKPILKPSLTTWLKNLRTEELEDAWIGKTLDLVSSILVDPPTSRLKALKAQVELDAICGSEEVFLERKCRFIKSEAPIPVDNSSVVGTRNREQGLHPVDRRPLSQTLNVAAPIIHTASYNNSPNPYSIDQGLHPLPPAQQYTPNHRQPGQSRNPSIVRTDTTSFQVISSPATTYPNSPDPSNQSNESSSQGHGTSLTADVTFVHLTAPDRAFKSVVCASSTRVGSMSKSSVLVHNFSIQSQWVPKRPPKSPDRVTNGFFGPQNIKCPDGFDWDLMSLCGSYVALRAHNRVEFKLFRFVCHVAFLDGRNVEVWNEDPFSTVNNGTPAPDAVNGMARHALEVKVNWRGDTLVILDDGLCYYSSRIGLHTLPIQGQLLRACFSSDGHYIFAWTLGRNGRHENRWYIWNASTSTEIMNVPTRRIPAERAGSGRTGLIFPLSRYFVAFEIPNRVYVVGKDINQRQVIQLRSPINDIVAGTAYENTESQSQGVILVQQHSPPRLINLQLLSDVQSSTSSRPQKLQEGFNTDTHGLAVVTDMAGVSLVVSHPSGLLERRKLLV